MPSAIPLTDHCVKNSVSTLVLVPTALEQQAIQADLPCDSGDQLWIQCCGFGVIAAAACSAELIFRYRPDRVLLIGIAGSLSDRVAVGQAYRFDRVVCYGVGAGTGASHQSAGVLGWMHFQRPSESLSISDHIDLHCCSAADESVQPSTLLTCCAASADPADVQHRLDAYPRATAEDMEGFAVAVACQLAGVPLDIVRGISNRAGDRDKSRWQIDLALSSAARLANTLLSNHSSHR